ncbi:UNKNOWN [Stylonychia lemnae]|uniref:Poly [ADP-ribose] polymerase n=1 Tax=Stylonychia lemnae TaxID=5949 RepID=A0A078APX7_STYLE|nr:UNKNOWN [Stylonychia lemnae]|eukprot:CDW84031.1 UNKNOWN [Stylonychia lemnae]
MKTIKKCEQQYNISISVKKSDNDQNSVSSLSQQFSSLQVTNNSKGYQWYYKVNPSDSNYGDRHDKVNNLFAFDTHQNDQIEAHYKKCCSNKTFGEYTFITGDQNQVQNGFKYAVWGSSSDSTQWYEMNLKFLTKRQLMRRQGSQIHTVSTVLMPSTQSNKNFQKQVYQVTGTQTQISNFEKQLQAFYDNPVNHNTTIVLKHYPNCLNNKVLLNELQKLATNQFRTSFEINDANIIKITGENYYEAKQRILEIIDFANKFVVPPTWENFSKMTDTNLLVCSIKRDSNEWTEIENQFKQTMSSYKIQNIERIQNKRLWRVFTVENQDVADRNNQNSAQTLMLYHGTGQNSPKLIYDGEEGFDMRYSNEGMWGKANYFAQNASYSHGYRHKIQNRTYQMFFARVTVGQNIKLESDTTLKMPPMNGNQSKRYDSVQGYTKGSNVFMIYANKKAYPEYLITYYR